MRKTTLLIVSLLFIAAFSSAQYKKVLDFNNTNGKNPYANLTASGNAFFGLTNSGGAYGYGVVFKIDSDGTGYKDIHDFDGTDGWYLYGSLILSGKMLFGLTGYGGAGNGNVFSVDTDGSNFKQVFKFNGSNGYGAYGSLILSAKTLYGMTYYGGASGKGNVFKVDTNGTNFKNLWNFTGGTDGYYPNGSLTLSGKVLFGMTSKGGINVDGNIFRIDTDGTAFKDIFDFSGANGKTPYGDLTLTGQVFYGTTYYGGASSDGVVFKVDTDGTQYKDLLDFNVINGSYPYNDVILSGKVLYGLTTAGGANSDGVAFKMDTDGSKYVDMLDFTGANGKNPSGTITISGNALFGTTGIGGASNDGLVFKLGLLNIIGDTMITNISCHNDSNGSASIKIVGGGQPYTYNWEPNGGSKDTATGLKAGTYTVSVMDAWGDSLTTLVTITQPTVLTVSTSGIVNISCNGGNNGSASATAVGGTPSYTYLWSPSGGSSSTATGLSAGTYTITLSDANGCAATATAVITQPAVLTVRDSASKMAICNGSCDSIQGVVSGGTPGYTFVWNNGNTNGKINECPANSTTYSLTLTDANGCTAGDSIRIKVNPLPTVTMSIGKDTICNTLSRDTLKGNPTGGTFSGSGVSGSNFNPSVAGIGLHTITYLFTDSLGCGSNDSVMVFVNNCTGINEAASGNAGFTLYPNPNSGKFQLYSAQPQVNSRLEVYNMLGEKVIVQSINGTNTLVNMSGTANGLYLYRVITQSGALAATGKFVISK